LAYSDKSRHLAFSTKITVAIKGLCMIDEQFLQTIPQYGIGGFVKGIFKKVKDTVKKIAPIAGAGIGFLIGGAAGAGIGSGIGSLIAGKSPKEALQAAALGYGIGSIAGTWGPFKQFAGKGMFGGKFAMGDKYNFLNKFIGPQEVVTADTSVAASGMDEVAYLESKNVNPEVFTKGSKETKDLVTATMIKDIGAKEVAATGGKKLLGGNLAGNVLMAGAVASPVLTYLAAKKEEEDFVPPDQMALNPLYYQDPQAYQLSGQGVKPYYYRDLQDYYGLPVEDLQTDFIRTSAKGGIIQLADGSEKYFPRKTGEINGPGTGTSDDIPAMLSDGEFVFTAQAVKNAGGGSRREGAKRMYEVMKNLEKGGTLSTQSRGVAA
jgi:hypothetical protein